MPESMNIADVLQAGYFPTSRARGRPVDDSGSSSSSGGGGGSNNNSDDDKPARRHPRRRAGNVYDPNNEPPSPPPQALTSNGSPTFRDTLTAGIPDPTVQQSRSRLDGVDADYGSAAVEHPPASPTMSGHQSPRHHRHQSQQYQHQHQRHTCNTSRRRLYPPSPIVEDEADSLAREHCRSSVKPRPAVDDEIPSKGDLEQCPIILEVHEHNPERRFVLVTPNDDSDDCYSPVDSPSDSVKYPPDAAEPYEANTGRKYDSPLTAAAAAAATTKRVSSDRDVRSGLDPPKRTRVRSTSCVNGAPPQVEQHQHQQPPRPTDGVPSRRSPPIDTYSGPEIVKQTAGGRERAYYDYSRPANGLSPSTTRNGGGGGSADGQHHQRSRSSYCDDRRYDDNGPVSSPQVGNGSGSGRRTQSTVESTASLDRFPDSLPGGGSRQEGRPSERAGTLHMRSGRSREPRRDSPPRRDDGHSSDEGRAGGLRPPAMLVRKATMDIGEGEDAYISPDTVMHPARSRGRTPTMPPPSRGPLKVGDDFSAGPRHSMPTLPMTEEERSGDGGADADPPYQTDDDSPRGGRSPVAPPPPLSRTRSRSRAPSAMRLSMPAMPMPMGPQSPTVSAASDRRSGQFGSDPRSPPMVLGSPGGGGGGGSGGGGGGGYWQPGVFDPDQARLGPDRPRGAYRRYSEDLAQTPRMPECRRRKPVAGKRDWMTLEQCPNFNICPTCFDGVFRDSALVAIHFIPAVGRPAELPIACDFGAVPWYRIAWLVMLKNRRADDLTPFHRITTAVKNAVLKGECCPGDRKTTRTWYSVVNPETRQHISRFDVCYSCASSIEIILPSLRGTFTPKRTATAGGEPTRSRCAMHFLDERKRFVQYFDVLETFADRAAAATAAAAATTSGGGGATSSPAEAEALARTDAEQLALQLERLASFVECREDKPIKDGGWHVMRNLPSLTVCGDCFDEVVRPRLEEGSMVARNFYVNAQRFPALTTCQLYSDRMQEVFRKACRKNDITYLETRVRERKEVEDGIRAKLEWLAKERDRERDRERGSGDREAKRLQERIDQLVHEWKKWE